MNLLFNDDRAYMAGHTIMPAVFGPFKRAQRIDWLRVAMAVVYTAAVVVAALDMFVWRPL
jgi:hypothetical protein